MARALAVLVAASAGLAGSASHPAPAGAALSMPGAALDFAGMGNTQSVAPPDTIGAAGPNNYVEVVNLGYEVWNKAGTVVKARTNTNTLWTGYAGTNAGNGCSLQNDGDAVVRYDRAADRWLIAQFSLPKSTTTGGPSFECVAVSKTGDPTGAYWLYDFKYNFSINDYPKIGVWPDAYYATFNLFDHNPVTTYDYKGVEVCAWDRTKMLAGLAVTQKCFALSTNFFSLQPANADGSVPPPAGAPEYLVSEDYSSNTATSTGLDVWKFHFDPAVPANSTLTGPTILSVNAYTEMVCSSGTTSVCIPQPGTTAKVDSLGERVMDRLVYRNFGTHEALVITHTVADSSRSGIAWWEIRLPGGTPTLYQQGVYNLADTNWRFMPTPAIDQAGDIVIGFSISDSSGGVSHPSTAWVGRRATDTLGTMGISEAILDIGSTNAAAADQGRWGDYAAMTIDPSDDCTFWYGNEIYNTSVWATRIAEAKLSNCAANDFTVSPNSPEPFLPRTGSIDDTVNTGLAAGSAESVALSVNDVPAGMTASLNPTTVTAGSPSTLTITTSGIAAGTYPLEVIGTAASAVHAARIIVQVTPRNLAGTQSPAPTPTVRPPAGQSSPAPGGQPRFALSTPTALAGSNRLVQFARPLATRPGSAAVTPAVAASGPDGFDSLLAWLLAWLLATRPSFEAPPAARPS